METQVRFIRARALKERWACSLPTIWRMRQRGELPAPTRISAGVVAWRVDVIEALEAARTPVKSALETPRTPAGGGR